MRATEGCGRQLARDKRDLGRLLECLFKISHGVALSRPHDEAEHS